MESLKDGVMFSSKYSSSTKQFPSCHVIVMSNSLPAVEGNLSRDRVLLLDISRLPREFLLAGNVPPRQNTDIEVPPLFDWCYSVDLDPSIVAGPAFTQAPSGPAPSSQRPIDAFMALEPREPSWGSRRLPSIVSPPSGGTADNNMCNNLPSAGQSQSSSDNEDEWEAMGAAPSGGNCTVALDVDTAHRLAAAPACAGVIANDQVDSNSSAREYPENFANLADEILAAVVLASEPLSASSEQSAEDRADQSPNSEPLATAPNDVIRVIDCNSNVDLEDLQQLCGELPQQSQSEATTESQTSGSPARKHKTLGKRDRKYFAAVGSADNPAMQREPRKRKTAT
jgi:hypothetical protein